MLAAAAGHVVEGRESLAPAPAELLVEHPVHDGRRHRRSGFLQAGQRLAVRGGGRFGQGGLEHRQRLAELHRSALELAEDGEQLLGGARLQFGLDVGGRSSGDALAEPDGGAAGDAERQRGELGGAGGAALRDVAHRPPPIRSPACTSSRVLVHCAEPSAPNADDRGGSAADLAAPMRFAIQPGPRGRQSQSGCIGQLRRRTRQSGSCISRVPSIVAGRPPSRKSRACTAASAGDDGGHGDLARATVPLRDRQLDGERVPRRVAVEAVQVGAAQATGQARAARADRRRPCPPPTCTSRCAADRACSASRRSGSTGASTASTTRSGGSSNGAVAHAASGACRSIGRCGRGGEGHALVGRATGRPAWRGAAAPAPASSEWTRPTPAAASSAATSGPTRAAALDENGAPPPCGDQFGGALAGSRRQRRQLTGQARVRGGAAASSWRRPLGGAAPRATGIRRRAAAAATAGRPGRRRSSPASPTPIRCAHRARCRRRRRRPPGAPISICAAFAERHSSRAAGGSIGRRARAWWTACVGAAGVRRRLATGSIHQSDQHGVESEGPICDVLVHTCGQRCG